MQTIDLNELTRMLQTAISPVALISGVGLLLLSMTNRVGRTLDRARIISQQIRGAGSDEVENLTIQLRILVRRCEIQRVSITFAIASIFFVSVLIIALFALSALGLNLQNLIVILFILSLVSLAVSLVLFIHDITLSLKALDQEVKGHAGVEL